MAIQETKFTVEDLTQAIKGGDLDTVEQFMNLSGEDILSQLGVRGQFDDLIYTAVDSGDLKMLKSLLKHSNLIQAPIDGIIDSLPENASEDMKKELENLARSEKRSNLQTYKKKWSEWQDELKKAEENGYDDLAEKLKKRMEFEDVRRQENEGRVAPGTSENRWFLNEKSWTLNGYGDLEYPMYGQDNADKIIQDLSSIGIQVDYSAGFDEKTNTLTDYRIRVEQKDVEKLKKFLEQKRQEKEDLEAIVSGHEEEESSNDTNENVVFVDAKKSNEVVDTWTPPEVKKENDNVEQEKKQRDEDMVTTENANKQDNYYFADPEREAENTSPDNSVSDTASVSEELTDEQPTPEHSDSEVAMEPTAEEKTTEEQPVAQQTQEVGRSPVSNNARTTFRDLNNLDAHMSPSEVLARLEDVELKENETQKKELFDEIKRQYQLKRENPDYKVQGLNGRINSTDMLKFAQHIDNVIDDGEPDNIDYTQGHTEKIRSLATLDRHLQISEVLARLEDVSAKTQDPNEQALLDLVREAYEEKRLNPQNDISGLNSFVDSTAGVNLAKRIDLAIDDGELENVDCKIMDTIQVKNEPQKEIVQEQESKTNSENSSERPEEEETSLLTPQEKAVVDKYHAVRSYRNLTEDEQKIWRSLGRKVEAAKSAEDVLKIVGADYSVGKNGNLKLHGTLPLAHMDLTTLPDMSSVVVEGNYACHDNAITSLKGSPQIVLGNVFAGDNPELESLEGKPRYIGGRFNVDNCPKLPSEALSELSNDLTREIRRPAPFSKDEEEVRMAPPERPEFDSEEEEVIRRPIKSTRPEIEGEEDLEVRRPGVSERYDEAEATDLEGRPDSWKLPEGAMKKGPGFEGNWEQGPDMSFKLTGVWKGSFKPYVRPYYFNPNVLSDEEKHRAMKMLTLRGIFPEHEMATEDMHTSLNPIREGDAVWVVRDKEQIKKLKAFWKAGRKNRDVAFGVDLYSPKESTSKETKPTPKVSKIRPKEKGFWKESGIGEEILDAVKEQVLDVAVPLNKALDKFNESVFEKGFDDPESLGSQVLFSMLAFPFNFLDEYLKRKAAKTEFPSMPESSKEKPGAPLSLDNTKMAQADALKKIMGKMVEKDPELFYQLAEKGVLGPKTDGMNQEQKAQNAQQILMQPENKETMDRLKATFGKVAKENPELIQGIYPKDYKGPVTPEILLNHVMGWDKTNPEVVHNIEKTVVQPQPITPVQAAPTQEMQAIMQQMQLLTAELKSLREEVAQLRQENAQLKSSMNQLTQENAQLKSENEALRSGKVIQKEEPEATNTLEQTKKEPTLIPDLNKLGSLNNSNNSMAKNIMDDDVPGFKETASMTPEELAKNPKAQFFNKIRNAYSTNETPTGLNDLVQTTEEAAWAEELAKAVENDNGDNVPRITKELKENKNKEPEQKDDDKPTPSREQELEEKLKKEKDKNKDLSKKIKDLKKQLKEQQANGSANIIINNQNIASVIQSSSLSGTERTNAENTVKSLEDKANKLQKKENALSDSQKELRTKHPELFDKFELNDQGKVVDKDGNSLKADEIRKELGLEQKDGEIYKAATQKGIIAILKAGNEAGKSVVENNPDKDYRPALKPKERAFFEDHPGLARFGLNKTQDGYINRHTQKDVSYDEIKKVALSNEWGLAGRKPNNDYSKADKLLVVFQKFEKDDVFSKSYREKYSPQGEQVKVAPKGNGR